MQIVGGAEEQWDVEQTARFLNFSTSWVYRRVAMNGIPHRKIGKSVRFSPRELHEWLEGKSVEAVR